MRSSSDGRWQWARSLAVALVCAGPVLACEGTLGSSSSPGLDQDPSGADKAGQSGTCEPRFERDLILLGDLPFVRSIAALFGAEALDGRLAPDIYTKSFSQKGNVANTSLVSGRLDWAVHATASLSGRVEGVTGCAPADDACIESYLTEFMRRAFRRPVGSEEIADLMTVYEEGKVDGFETGVQLALQAVLISPSFNHRTEYGTLTESGAYELTPHEVASTLSFLLTDSLPDEELLAAADSGALADPAERQRHALRLTEDPDTRDAVEKTLLAAWTLGNLFGKVKDPGLYPEFSSGLASQMYRETELFLSHHLWDAERGVSAVLDSRTSFVNEALANVYGVPFPGDDPQEFVRVELPADTRAGLMTQASVMTTLSRTDQTSVVSRGLFVNGPLLCLPKIPSPPEEAIAAVEAQLEADSTELERAEHRAETSPCKNCHAHFDAFGLAFESYDAIGRFRTDIDGAPIDPSVDLSQMTAFDGTFEGAVHLAEHLAERPEFVECIARHLLTYGTGENGISRNDCEVQQMAAQLSPQSTLQEVVSVVAGTPSLSLRKGANP